MPLVPGFGRAFALVGAAFVLAACGPGAPTRVVVGHDDTFVVHSTRPTPIVAEARDAEGRPVSGVRITYRHLSGGSVALSSAGTVTCTHRADAKLLATVGVVSTTAVVRCQPVRSVKMSGPIQFLLGDTAQSLAAQVLGLDGKPLDVIAGSVAIGDRSVAGAEGMRISARGAGGTLVTLTVGDSSASTEVHVYEPLDALVRLRPEQEFVAVRLSLRSSEYRRWNLPPGTWMLTMLPYRDERRGIRLRVSGANCVPDQSTPRRVSCSSKDSVSVTVEHPSKTPAPELEGQLLVRRLPRT